MGPICRGQLVPHAASSSDDCSMKWRTRSRRSVPPAAGRCTRRATPPARRLCGHSAQEQCRGMAEGGRARSRGGGLLLGRHRTGAQDEHSSLHTRGSEGTCLTSSRSRSRQCRADLARRDAITRRTRREDEEGRARRAPLFPRLPSTDDPEVSAQVPTGAPDVLCLMSDCRGELLDGVLQRLTESSGRRGTSWAAGMAIWARPIARSGASRPAARPKCRTRVEGRELRPRRAGCDRLRAA